MLSIVPTFVSLIALPLTLALAPPYPSNSTTNVTINPLSLYYLKTRVVGSGNADKNDLYFSGYHTGAGLNDVVLRPFDADILPTAGYLNETFQQFNLEVYHPALTMDNTEAAYAAWKFVFVETPGTPGFFFNASGLQWNSIDEAGFAGWLACDWWHGVPQLFWKYEYFDITSLPSSCALIELFPVAV